MSVGNVQSKNADVFLSYSHNDSALVERIADSICAAGFSSWIDKDELRAQENFNAAIDSAIDKSIVFIAFLSKTYVNKPYCIHEFDRAIDKQKSILAVCIDDVSENTNRQNAYLFSFSAGHNILGFGSGIDDSDSSIESFALEIIASVPMEQLKRYSVSGDINDYPPISTPDYIIARLRLYHERQYEQSGNYALNEIRSELFPAIRNSEINVLYKDDNNKDVSLVKFFSEVDGQADHDKHILITGEGGAGKTVSLLKTCEYLLGKRINAIYVPLSKIDADLTLDQYLERIVCGGNQRLWRDLRDLMSVPYTTVPNVVLLLDGINEVSLSYIELFVKRIIKKTYIDAYCGVKLVMTSRWFDNSLMHSLKENVVSLEMQPLNKEAINLYLQNMGLPSVVDEKVLSVIRTPLMLTLFADVEKHKDKYQNIEGIVLEENPNTAGKILSNFFQTQLYRAAEEESFDRAAHLVLLEYLLPSLAYKMIEKQSLYLSEDDVWDSIDEINDEGERYSWYKRDKLRKLIRGRSRIDADTLIALAEGSLHFLHKSDSGYEFLHQSFRDYFAAFHISNEMKSFAKDAERMNAVESVLQQRTYSDEILGFVSDILHEENAQPILSEQGWEFPDKESVSASKKSVAEQLLSLWRNKAGKSTQNAVANIVNIMKIGRQNLMAWCDFSHLDLRKCWLNKCRFTIWYEDKYYSSIFDGAWIDRTNFLSDGHEAQISAIVFDGISRVFSGDKNGVVKVYSVAKHVWIDSIQLQSSAVVDLAWEDNNEMLAIMYENIVFCYSVKKKAVVSSYGNNSKSKNFRYVQFTKDNEVNVSFDLEPLIWCDVHGNKLPSELSYDVPARCAKWNPRRKEFIRSNMLQLISVARFDDRTLSWELPPTLKKKLDDDNRLRKESQEKTRATQYMSLRDAGATGSGSICCIQYNENGSRVLVAIQNLLVEYDAESFDVLNRKVFSANIQCACYLRNGIAVGSGTNLIVLDSDFSEESALQGSQIKQIGVVSEDYEGNGYYVFSSNGEVKKLNHELIVQNMRFTGSKTGCVWVRDRLTNSIQMAFLPWKRFPFGARYSYETDRIEPLGWRYEFVDIPEYSDDDEQRVYKMDSSLLVIERFPPYRKLIYSNYTGIWIFGCSFNGIHGDMSNRRNINFLIQNGGIVHDITE
ncbi:hypothetical protein B5F08_08035 [Anaeromassilibacillus sp. An172]|uniref:TIR domain-containing protein n=1 Tax=Anaeromassilibacillus sp. An172 TaxID=1965570 RepID=UPI000B36D101|nr:TIR domain-containing protein [Anaeromassilibacillus sp. An172]OUP77719.1 hypothetical protein B5F08_08035 [Anaeromassilibacillus sp. An172]